MSVVTTPGLLPEGAPEVGELVFVRSRRWLVDAALTTTRRA